MNKMIKKITIFICLIFVFLSCSSDDNNKAIDSNIIIDGRQFKPTSVIVDNQSTTEQGALHFSLTRGNSSTSDNETIMFTVEYPLNLNAAPNGIYQFHIGNIFDSLFANGIYFNGTDVYSLAGNFVKVTSLGGKKYRLEFQEIEAVNINNISELIVISGYCEGDFK